MATREKMHPKSNVGKVDMEIVSRLIGWRNTRNCQLVGTKYSCTLHPDVNKKICNDCPETIRKECFKYEWERDYIHKQDEASKSNQRRKKKQNNPKYDGLNDSGQYDADDDDYEEDSDNYYDAEAMKYPCKAMYFACPDKDCCKYGRKCPY